MVVCANCIVIPDSCYSYTITYSGKRDTCCKCKEYKEYVMKVDVFYGPNRTKKEVRAYEKIWPKSKLNLV